MPKVKAIIQILLGIFLSYTGFSQAKLLVYLCQQEAMLGWLSMDVCLLSRYILLVLGLLSLIIGIIKLSLHERIKDKESIK